MCARICLFCAMYQSILYHCVVIVENPKVDFWQIFTYASAFKIMINSEDASGYRYIYTSIKVGYFYISSNIGKL